MLSDADQKARYDRNPLGSDFSGDGGFHSSGGFQSAEDLFANMFRDFNMQGGQQQAASQVMVDLTFNESVHGCKKTVEYTGPITCEPCG